MRERFEKESKAFCFLIEEGLIPPCFVRIVVMSKNVSTVVSHSLFIVRMVTSDAIYVVFGNQHQGFAVLANQLKFEKKVMEHKEWRIWCVP